MNKPLLKTIAARPGTALGEQDIHLFREGTHSRLHQKLGCHLHATGARFALWAPNARSVSVIGDFNAWNVDADQAQARADGSGIWELDVRGVEAGQRYKFAVFTQTGERLEKADPFAFRAELAPATASIAWRLDGHTWADGAWMAGRAATHGLNAPMSVYEVHLGSWRRAEDGEMLDYRTMARLLTQHVTDLGFTHVELMPITEHPFYGSWGYQTLGLYAPTARFGSPDGFARFVDACHAKGLGVLSTLGPMRTLWQQLGHQFTDPRLRQLFARYATYCGSSPWQSPATLMLIAQVEMDGVWSVEGGMVGILPSPRQPERIYTDPTGVNVFAEFLTPET